MSETAKDRGTVVERVDPQQVREDPHKFGVRTEEEENSETLHIYRDNADGMHGLFLINFIEAVIHADGPNFAILKPAADEIMKKYDLKCTCTGGDAT